MKKKQVNHDADFIGAGRPFTKEDEIAIGNFIRANKAKKGQRQIAVKRKIESSQKKVVA